MNHAEVSSADYWKLQMLQGNFENAWKFSDDVLAQRKNIPCWHLPRHQQYIWNGSSLENKVVLVRCYHGLGDTIMFIRYARLLKNIAKQVIVWAQKPLLPLLESVNGIDALIPLHDGSPEVDYDVDVEIMELPHIFRTTCDSIPAATPYLHTQPVYLPSQHNKLNVGLTWKVSEWETARSVPFSFLKPLFDVKNISIHILQQEPEKCGWQIGFGKYTGDRNLYDYARVIKSLDLLITVDSMPAHLAGAQNVPVFTMLRKDVDWRWMSDRVDSPWYPSMRLFRQQKEGDWSPVVRQVKDALEKFSMR